MNALDFNYATRGDIVLYNGDAWEIGEIFKDGYIKLVDTLNGIDVTEVHYTELDC